MARPQSIFLTAVVSMVLGILIGVVGLAAATGALAKNAQEVANEQSDQVANAPQVYGNR